MADDVRDGSPDPTPEEALERQSAGMEAEGAPALQAGTAEAPAEAGQIPEAGTAPGVYDVPDPGGEPGSEKEGGAAPPAMGVVEALLYASGKAATVEHLAEAAELEPAEVEEPGVRTKSQTRSSQGEAARAAPTAARGERGGGRRGGAADAASVAVPSR